MPQVDQNVYSVFLQDRCRRWRRGAGHRGESGIAQESFLAAVRALDRFDRRRPFGPWLHRIVVNRAIDWARARALRREVADVAERGAEDRRELSEELAGSLASLSPEHRAVIVLRHLLEYTPGEIAGMLELPRGTVNSRLRRALDRLLETIEVEG